MQVDFDYGVDSIEMVIINSMAPMESFTAELGRGQSEFPIKNYIGQQARQAPAGKRPWQDGSSQEEEHSLNPETRCQGEKVCCFNWVLPSLCLHVSEKVPRKRSNNFAGDEMIVVLKEEWDSLGQFFKLEQLKRLIVEPTNLFMNLIIFTWSRSDCPSFTHLLIVSGTSLAICYMHCESINTLAIFWCWRWSHMSNHIFTEGPLLDLITFRELHWIAVHPLQSNFLHIIAIGVIMLSCALQCCIIRLITHCSDNGSVL